MGGFFAPPQFTPIEPPLPNGPDGDVLTIVGGSRAWAPASGGGSSGTLGAYITDTPAAGAHVGYAPAGFTDETGRLDIDTSNGDIEIVTLTQGTDGQLLNIGNTGNNALQLDNSGFRVPGSNLNISPGSSELFCWYDTVNLWVLC
jgi:hypothetical protein